MALHEVGTLVFRTVGRIYKHLVSSLGREDFRSGAYVGDVAFDDAYAADTMIVHYAVFLAGNDTTIVCFHQFGCDVTFVVSRY